MEVLIHSDADEVARGAARRVACLLERTPEAVLGLATGSTMVPVYVELARLHREEGLDFSAVTTFNLDEFVGLPPDHPGSYRAYMRKHFVERVNVRASRVHLPDGNAEDIPEACARYEAAIRDAGGIDLQLLGIGRDGHIAFNEPTSSLASRTRIKTLTAATMDAFPPEREVPRHVVTMGVGTILEAHRCLLLATGQDKAEAVARMVEGPLTALVPASALQLHPDTTVLVDEAAASRLALAGYYREVAARKPDWQRERDGD